MAAAPPPQLELPSEAMQELQRAQQLRSQAQALGTRLAELRLEMAEHDRVIAVLRDIDGQRMCFRLIGEVLVERKVMDVIPELEATRAQLAATIERGTADQKDLDESAIKLMQPHANVLEALGRQEMQAQQAM